MAGLYQTGELAEKGTVKVSLSVLNFWCNRRKDAMLNIKENNKNKLVKCI